MMNLNYGGISTYQFIPYYASVDTNTRILKPFEDREPIGLKVDIATKKTVFAVARDLLTSLVFLQNGSFMGIWQIPLGASGEPS